MYTAGVPEKKWSKSSGRVPLCHPCINLIACRRYTKGTVNISKMFSKGSELLVFLRHRIEKNINLIT